MEKGFLQYLIVKPNNYILVWAYIFSRLNEDNKAQIYIYELLGRYKVPKSTLKRIVKYGSEYYSSKMNYKWASNHLIISVLNISGGSDSVLPTKGKVNTVVKKRTQKEPTAIYSKMIKEYDKFCHDISGVGSKIDGQQGKAMKSIIVFLKKQCLNKNPNLTPTELDNNIILSWEYILKHWNKLDTFNRGRIKLSEINSNLLNILVKLKEQPIDNKQKQRNEQINKAVSGATTADYSKLGN